MKSQTRIALVRETCRRFRHMSHHAIARYLIDNHGPMFDGNVEVARCCVRRVFGKQGRQNRANCNPELFDDVRMPETWNKKRHPYKLQPGTWLVMADLHVPFHETKPIESAFQWAKMNHVDGILFLGDVQDCEYGSYWPVPRRDFLGEVEATIDFLDFVRKEFPDTKLVYKPGNHEYRLPKLYMSFLPQLAQSPLACMENALGFEERGIEFLDYYQIIKAGKLSLLHGHEVRKLNRMVNPARGLFLRAKENASCAHCHTTSKDTRRTLNGECISAWSIGCMCDLSPDYNPYCNDWNWGFAGLHLDKSGSFEIENREIGKSGKVK